MKAPLFIYSTPFSPIFWSDLCH